jgi:hypothetical protein
VADAPQGRPNQTVADYVTIALSPALIIGLVGSLVFFLLEVFYRTDGQWKERLQWILFFYVFGVVLAARVSMNGDTASRAPLYGGVLAVLTLIGMQLFVEYPEDVKQLSFLVNLLLVAVVWWCAHRLTWDCTNVDEETDMSGEGLLQASGLEEGPRPKEDPVLLDEAEPKKQLSWWERYQRYREEKSRKRTLGVWVVYFSLAALPVFGLGQSLIPLTAPERRRFAFWLMTLYVGCGLGLLLTTCFLGLRRYLRQKRLRMPAAMTGMWLTVGGGLVAGLLLVGALMPRPYSEYPLLDIVDPAGSAKRKASRVAFKGDSPGAEKGKPGATTPDGKDPSDKTGEKGSGKGQGDSKDGKSGQGDNKDGKSGGEQGKDKGEQGKGEKGEKGKDGKSDKDEKSEEGDKSKQSGKGGKSSDPGKTAKGMKEMEKGRRSSSRLSGAQQFLQRVGPVLKWIVFAVLALLVVVALARGGLGFLSNFTDWAKRLLEAWNRFWANLFGGRRAEGAEEEAPAPEVPRKRTIPFSSFANPFESGAASRMPARELVRYTFAALEAWARERGLARRDDETPLEFVGRLGDEVPSLEAEARRLAGLQARAEYAREKLPASTAQEVRAFWERLERVAAAPLSA